MITHAKQIWIEPAFDNQYIQAKQSFGLTNIPQKAAIYIYCETEYTLFINGQFVASGQYKSFENNRFYDTADITSFLVAGENTIIVDAYHQGENSSAYAHGKAGLTFALDCGETKVLSGNDTLVRLHPNYISGDMEKVTRQLGFVYHYDASKAETPWQNAYVYDIDIPFAPRPVKPLLREMTVTGKICAQGLLKREDKNGSPAQIMQKDYLSAREKHEIFNENTIAKNCDGTYFVIDLGKEYAGIFTMDIEAGENTIIDIGYGEHLDDLRVRTSVGGRNFTCRYICKSGKQQFVGNFRRFGCRYIQINITNMTNDIRLNEIGLIPTVYTFANKENFECNDYFINKLYSTCIETLKACAHEHYEDCPWREQALYAFDSYVQMMCGYYAFGEYSMPRASLELLADSLRDDGLFEICAPAHGPRTIPSFALSWIISLEKYVLYSGDVEFGTKMLSTAKAIINHFAFENNIVKIRITDSLWNFYEWTPGLDGTEPISPDSPSNFYYIIACEAYNKICTYAGLESEYDVSQLKNAVKEMFYDNDKKLFKTDLESGLYHEFTQSLAILSGVSSDPELAQKLIDKDNGLIKVTLSTAIYKYDAILSFGNKNLEKVMDEIADVWGEMIYAGATTLWETSQGAWDFDNAGSLCHGWSAVPLYVLYRYVIGYRPTEPGFAKKEIKPCTTRNITSIQATLYTPDSAEEFHL